MKTWLLLKLQMCPFHAGDKATFVAARWTLYLHQGQLENFSKCVQQFHSFCIQYSY